MGMYTQMYFSGVVKPEFRNAIYHVAFYDEIENGTLKDIGSFVVNTDSTIEEDDEILNNPWYTTGIPCFMEFAKNWRSDLIIGNGFTKFNLETGQLRLVSDIKNYDDTYEEFFELCREIMDSVDIAVTHYEEDDYIRIYVFEKDPDKNKLNMVMNFTEYMGDCLFVNDEEDMISLMEDSEEKHDE